MNNTVSVFAKLARSFTFRGAGALANFMFVIAVGRSLGAAETGIFMLGFGFVLIFSTIARLGLEQVVLREATPAIKSSDIKCISSVYFCVLSMVSIASIVGSVVVYFLLSRFLALFIDEISAFNDLIILVCVTIPFVSLAYIHVPFLQSARKPESSVAILGFWIPFVSLIAIYLFEVSSAYDVFWLFLSSCVITAIISFWQWLKLGLVKLKFLKELTVAGFNSFFISGYPLLVGNVFLMSIPWVPIYVASFYCHPEVVGLISVAQRISLTLSGLLLPPIEAFIAPKISDLKQDNSAKLEEYCRKISTFLALVVFFVICLISLLGQYLLGAFGDGFEQAYSMLLILSFGQLIFVACGPTRLLIVYFGGERFIRDSLFISFCFCLIASFILIPFLGGTGAAIATLLAVSGQKIGEVVYAYKKVGIKTYPSWGHLYPGKKI